MKQCSDPGCQKLVNENGINTQKHRLGNSELFFCDYFCKDEWYKREIGLQLPLNLQHMNGG